MSPASPDLPDSPVGRQAAWYLAQMAKKGEGLTAEEAAEHLALPPPFDPAQAAERFRTNDDGRSYRLDRVIVTSDAELGVVFDYDDGKPFRLTLEVEPDPPHRIIRTWWARDIPEDIVIRQANDGDARALNDLEVRAPMTLGQDTTLVYDRGHDFLAFSRLMEENVSFVAERNGDLLGIACGAAHDVRIGGQRYRVMLLHHLRVPVEHRKLGVFSTLNGYVFGHYGGRTDAAYGYTALDNAEAMRIGGPGTWDTGVFRVVIDTAAVTAEGAPARVATPHDAEEIVDVLNRCHDHEEAFLPYTVATLTERMNRAPDLYGWGQLRIGDGAVLGVWPAGLGVTATTGGVVTRSVRAVALDHGFAPGHEGAFASLLGATCRELRGLGHTEVTFVLSEASPGYEVIAPLAVRLDPFAFRMAVPEPPGTIERGVYVDPVYF